MKARGYVLAGLAAMATAASVAPAAASPQTQANFTIHFPKGHPASNAPCDPDSFCGVGSVAGYGSATITIVDETFDQIEGTDCLAVTRVEQVDLLNGAGALALDSTGTFCRPGGSGGSHAGPNSYGSPGKWRLVSRVDPTAGTGVFAGVRGRGTESMVTAGGVGRWHLALRLISS
jgi:hypothetical protein